MKRNNEDDWYKIPSFSKPPQVTVDVIRVIHNVIRNCQYGMEIHLENMKADNLLDEPCFAIAFFFFDTGQPLKDFNHRFSTPDGQVATLESFTPMYENALWKDFVLFIPYEELHLDRGRYNLQFKLYFYANHYEDSIGVGQPFFFSYAW